MTGLAESCQTTYTEDIDLTVSDLEDDRLPVKYVVEKVSKDQRRVLKTNIGHVSVSESEAHGSASRRSNTVPANTNAIDDQLFEWDLGNIDVEALRSSTSHRNKKEPSSRRRYISSVSDLTLITCTYELKLIKIIGEHRMSR